MELRRLRHLIAVAEHGNFGRAAAASYITQPALSRSIQALEAEVGGVLFDRRPSGVELTDLGQVVLRHARALVAGARDLDREIRLTKGMDLGELRVGVGQWGGALLVAPVIGRLHAQHPGLRMRVILAPWRELPARLLDRDVDLVVGGVSEIEPREEFETDRLMVQDLVVVGRSGHPLADRLDVSLADVFGFPLAGPGLESDAAELLTGLAAAIIDGPPAPPSGAELLTIECDSSDALKRMLMESDALTFMPRFLVDEELRQGRLAIVSGVDLGLRVRFGAAWLRGRTLGGAGTTFLDLLRANAETWSGHPVGDAPSGRPNVKGRTPLSRTARSRLVR